MSVGVEVHTSGLEMWLSREPERSEALSKGLKRDVGFLILEELLSVAPYRKGHYVGSIKIEETEKGVKVGPHVDYSRFVEEGTGMFGPRFRLIRPKKAKVLHWVSETGKHVFAMYTVGMPGQFPVKRAREAAKPRIFELGRKIWRETHG